MCQQLLLIRGASCSVSCYIMCTRVQSIAPMVWGKPAIELNPLLTATCSSAVCRSYMYYVASWVIASTTLGRARLMDSSDRPPSPSSRWNKFVLKNCWWMRPTVSTVLYAGLSWLVWGNNILTGGNFQKNQTPGGHPSFSSKWKEGTAREKKDWK